MRHNKDRHDHDKDMMQKQGFASELRKLAAEQERTARLLERISKHIADLREQRRTQS